MSPFMPGMGWTPSRSTLEKNSDPEERGFLYSLWENPDDIASRNAYVDWLRDQGREYTAMHVEYGITPEGVRGVTSGYRRDPTTKYVIPIAPVMSGQPVYSDMSWINDPHPFGSPPIFIACGSMQMTTWPGNSGYLFPHVVSGNVVSGV